MATHQTWNAHGTHRIGHFEGDGTDSGDVGYSTGDSRSDHNLERGIEVIYDTIYVIRGAAANCKELLGAAEGSVPTVPTRLRVRCSASSTKLGGKGISAAQAARAPRAANVV